MSDETDPSCAPQWFVQGFRANIWEHDASSLSVANERHLIEWTDPRRGELTLVSRFDARCLLESDVAVEGADDVDGIADVEAKLLAEEETMCDAFRYGELNERVAHGLLVPDALDDGAQGEGCNDGDDDDGDDCGGGGGGEMDERGDMRSAGACVPFKYADTPVNVFLQNAAGIKDADEGSISVSQEKDHVGNDNADDDDDEDFSFAIRVAEKLTEMPDVIVPRTERMHALIHRTAAFVRSQGAQMEILLKVKQAGNDQFAFMSAGTPLYAYYRLATEGKILQPWVRPVVSAREAGVVNELVGGYASDDDDDDDQVATAGELTRDEYDRKLREIVRLTVERVRELGAPFEEALRNATQPTDARFFFLHDTTSEAHANYRRQVDTVVDAVVLRRRERARALATLLESGGSIDSLVAHEESISSNGSSDVVRPTKRRRWDVIVAPT